MKFIEKKIQGMFLVEPSLHQDDRGVFRRSFCVNEFAEAGIDFTVKQGNISQNFHKHTLRGFHYQVEPSQESKVISCVTGGLYNIVLDLRKGSRTYHHWVSLEIDADKGQSIVVPAGCANAFLTTQTNTIVHYYMGDTFSPNSYRGIRYNDPEFGFEWPCEPAVISEKDLNLPDYLPDYLPDHVNE